MPYAAARAHRASWACGGEARMPPAMRRRLSPAHKVEVSPYLRWVESVSCREIFIRISRKRDAWKWPRGYGGATCDENVKLTTIEDAYACSTILRPEYS